MITTARATDQAYVKRLGADRAIDYTTEDFVLASGPCDVVFDTVGNDVQVRSYAVLKPGGRLVRVVDPPSTFVPPRADVQTLRPFVSRDRAHLEQLISLFHAKAIVPTETHCFKLADAGLAHRAGRGPHLAWQAGALAGLTPRLTAITYVVFEGGFAHPHPARDTSRWKQLPKGAIA